MAYKLISELTSRGTVANSDMVEVQVSGQVVTKRTTVEDLTKIERDLRIAQDDVIEASVGLNTDGSYPTPSGTNYLDASTDVMDALDKLDNAISGSGEGIVVDVVTVSSANLNNAGIAPYGIIAAQGVGKTIELLSCTIYLNYNSSAVDCASQKLILQYDGAASHFMEWANSFIESSSSAINKGTWTSNVELEANTKIELTFDASSNPTAGDTNLVLWVAYIVREYAP